MPGEASSQIAPGCEIEQLQFDSERQQFHVRQAGVFHSDKAHLGKGQREQYCQHHADDPAVTDHGNILTGMGLRHLPQTRFNSGAKAGNRFGIGNSRCLQFLGPLGSTGVEPFADLDSVKPSPGAKINFLQALQDDRWRSALGGKLGQRLLCPFHRTGIKRVDGPGPKVLCQQRRLLLAARREAHVDPPAKDVSIGRLDFTVTQ